MKKKISVLEYPGKLNVRQFTFPDGYIMAFDAMSKRTAQQRISLIRQAMREYIERNGVDEILVDPEEYFEPGEYEPEEGE